MKTHLILSAAALALAACGSSGGDKGEGAGNSAAAAESGGGSAGGAKGGGGSAAGTGGASGSAVQLQPGEWEIKMEVVDIEVAGLPEGVAEGMKSQAGGGTNRTCMTPEDAKGPSAEMFGKNDPANCKSEGFAWSGGRILGKTTCQAENGQGKTVMTMDGRYTPQNIDMTMKTQTDMMGKDMTMQMRVTGRRVGECTAATKKG
ncbi:MAG TPA: DUF3617 domain-containing protein [Allosphingosinicella sp.]|jgi:hypothetical protein